MLTVTEIFIQATYALAISVLIRIISALTDRILNKLFEPNFLGGLIFVDHTFSYQIFLLQIFFDPIFLTKIVKTPT